MMKQTYTQHDGRGVTIFEIMIGIGLVSLILVFTTHAITRFVEVGGDIADKTEALYLAEESLEALRFLRDGSWSTVSGLTDGTEYYLSISSTTIGVTTTPEWVGIFRRSFVIDSVERDGNDDIVTSGTPDGDSKYITASVSWGAPTSTVSLTTILADLQDS